MTAPLNPNPELGARRAAPAMLVCDRVEVAYGPAQVLFGVDLEVRQREIVALLGTNGAGKSTLLKAISQLLAVKGGTITFDGHDLTRTGGQAAARHGIVLVPGGSATFPTLSVAEHFKVGTWLLEDLDRAEIAARQDEVLELFPRLRDHWRDRGGDLSGGEQQQLALAMAFTTRPRLLVIDELSLGLAPVIVEQLLEIVQRMHEQGSAVLLVEQSVNVALDIASRVYFMEKGEIRYTGTSADLLSRPDIIKSVMLQSPEGSDAPDDCAEEIRGLVASRAPVRPSTSLLGNVDVALSVSGLTRRFGGVTATQDVSFTLRRGEVLGLVGPNGAGKTTIFDMISGFLTPHAGRVTLAANDVTRWSPQRRAQAGLGRSFQDARVFPALTTAQNIAVALDRHLDHRDHVAALLDLPAVQEMEAEVRLKVDELLERFGLQDHCDLLAAELSTGTRRVLDLAMVVAHEPTVLLLDEPSSGVAQHETGQLADVLLDLRATGQCAILLIEHDMSLISRLSDELIALEQGRIVANGSPQHVLNDPRVIEIYLGKKPAPQTRR